MPLTVEVAGGPPFDFGLAIYRGDSHAWRFTLWADSDRAAPLDLTGAEVTAQIRSAPDARDAVDLLCQVTPPNVVAVHLAGEASARAPAPAGRWDMQAVYDGGAVATLIAGPVTTTKDVTRP